MREEKELVESRKKFPHTQNTVDPPLSIKVFPKREGEQTGIYASATRSASYCIQK